MLFVLSLLPFLFLTLLPPTFSKLSTKFTRVENGDQEDVSNQYGDLLPALEVPKVGVPATVLKKNAASKVCVILHFVVLESRHCMAVFRFAPW